MGAEMHMKTGMLCNTQYVLSCFIIARKDHADIALASTHMVLGFSACYAVGHSVLRHDAA